MKSLRLRLVLLTTAAVAVVWLVTAVFTWRSALHEIEDLLRHPPATARHMQKERADLAGEIAEHLLLPMLDISATDIRQRVAAGADISQLVPPEVARYIESHGLYRATPRSSSARTRSANPGARSAFCLA